jgi:hypothetical protein
VADEAFCDLLRRPVTLREGLVEGLRMIPANEHRSPPCIGCGGEGRIAADGAASAATMRSQRMAKAGKAVGRLHGASASPRRRQLYALLSFSCLPRGAGE